MAYLLSAPYSYFTDSNGLPLSGGSVFTYAAGTTTPQASYTDSTGGSPASNPVILDSAGRASIWLIGSYKIVVADSFGNTIKTTDNITATAATPAELNYLSGVTPGTATASHAVVTDSLNNISGLNTATFGTTSTGIANMAAVQGSMAGGFINMFRNPGMKVMQRGTNVVVNPGSAYTLDGWIVGCAGSSVTATATSANGGFGGALAITGNTGVTDTFIKQRIEGSIAARCGNQIVTVQITANNATGGSVTPTITVNYANAADNFSAVTAIVSSASMPPLPNGGWTTIGYTFSVGAAQVYNGMEVIIDFGASINTNAKVMFISYPDIRITNGVTTGVNTNPPVPEIRPVSIEMPYCQRYLAGYGDIAGVIGSGASTSTTAAGFYIPFKQTMRIAPTALAITTAADFEIATYAGVDVSALSSMAIVAAGTSNQGAVVSTVGTSLTNATPYYLYAKTALAGNLIFTGAEL